MVAMQRCLKLAKLRLEEGRKLRKTRAEWSTSPTRPPARVEACNEPQCRVRNHSFTLSLLGSRAPPQDSYVQQSEEEHNAHRVRRIVLGGVLTFIFVAAVVLSLLFLNQRGWPWEDEDPLTKARTMLSKAPVIDGHIDLPILVRFRYANNVSDFDLHGRMPAHVDIPRLREGKVGGFFWSVFVECKNDGPYFTLPSYRVRDTLEQIDVAHLMIDKYSDTFALSLTTDDIKTAMREHKIASMLGVEGAHQLGNSLGVLRQYYSLGVRYMTLTHGCHNAFADSGGIFVAPAPLHNGLSKLGEALIYEMNRLGMLVDLSHVSDDVMRQALNLSQAPVIWSHSSARAVHNVSRNVPDDILELLNDSASDSAHWRGKGNKTDGVVMVNFAPFFVANDGEATLEKVADHIEHIGKISGRDHVGLGSDFDGIGDVPEGLEDVSKYPQLVAELIKRGWSRQEVAGLSGGNLLRVFKGAEKVAEHMKRQGAVAAMDLYSRRPDIPAQGPDWVGVSHLDGL